VSRLRVVIADDQPMMRAGFKAILEATGDIEIVAEAGTGTEAVRVVRALAPDVVLMDIRMPEMDGIEATRRLAGQRILVLTTFAVDEYIIEALRAGASGLLLKDASTRELVDAVRAVASGDAVLSPRVTRQLLDQVGRRLPAPVRRAPDAMVSLTDREREVLSMIAGGMTNAEIATALVLAEATVKTHVSHLFGKLGLRDRVQAVIFAYEHGVTAVHVQCREAGDVPRRAVVVCATIGPGHAVAATSRTSQRVTDAPACGLAPIPKRAANT
jgi:DNA-binding NarL/FixJ family response regulator